MFGKYMVKNGIKGNILNIASSSSLRPAVSAYTISKWGIRGLTMGLARALAPHGITVNGIAPGQTATPMLKKENRDNINNPTCPLGRWILPEEIANGAVFLVSDMGRAVLGDIVYMTGGAALLSYEDMNYNIF
jgi:NAD(P)-dependent dehydrogenase (short-subunit alcohol dehydrogenase family)